MVLFQKNEKCMILADCMREKNEFKNVLHPILQLKNLHDTVLYPVQFLLISAAALQIP
jgi:hypothetical protein